MKTLNAETQRGAEVCGEKEYTSRRESYERKVSEWEDAQRIVNAPMVHVQLAVDPIEGPGQLVGYVVLGRLLDWFPVYVVVAPLPWARRLAHSRVVPDTPLGDLVFAVWEAASGLMIGEPFTDEKVCVLLAENHTKDIMRLRGATAAELFNAEEIARRAEQFRASAWELASRYVAEQERGQA